MKTVENLDKKEMAQLLKAPALVSVQAASTDGEVDAKEREAAIHLSHLRTFTSHPILQDYYKEVEKTFEHDFDTLNNTLPAGTEERKAAINEEMEKVNEILASMDTKFATLFLKSLKTYAAHISKVHRNALEYFILPGSFPGLTD